MTIMVLSFSHQQLARYPTDIGETTANNLYHENKNSLKYLIDRIKSVCLEIRASLDNPS